MFLTEKQIEIITGSLLGDGCLRVKNRGCSDNACFVKSQSKLDHLGVNKTSYMQWHYKELCPFSSSVGVSVQRNEYEFRTKSLEVFTKLEEQWYLKTKPKRTKVVPKTLKLTPLTVCIWFMDDGSNYPEKRQARIYSNSFTKEENEFLIWRLKNDIDVESTIQKHEDQFCIYIGAESYRHLIDMIKPFCVWDCFQYKHDLSRFTVQTYACGEFNGASKLTQENVFEIKEMATRGVAQKDIAKKFSINPSTVSRIANAKRWYRYLKLKTKEEPSQP